MEARYLHNQHMRRLQALVLRELCLEEPLPQRTITGATLPGDERRLRGIPAIGRGVAGAIPGTNPGRIRD